MTRTPPPPGHRSPRRPPVTVDLTLARANLEAVLEVVNQRHGTLTELDPPQGPARRSNAEQAALGQDLLRAAAAARLAASQIEAEYWRIRSAPKESSTGGSSPIG